MTSIEILHLSVAIIAIIVGVICYHLVDLDRLFNESKYHLLKHDKYFTDIERKRVDDLGKLAALEQRVRVLEEKLEASEFPDPEDE